MGNIVRINELPENSGNLTNDDVLVFMDDPSGSKVTKKVTVEDLADMMGGSAATYDAAVEWTPNHTLVDGTRYLAGDLVYSGGNLYRAKFDNESIPVTDTTYWENVGPGYRLNIDGRDIPNIPNPFDQDLNTTDFPSFSGVSLSNGTTLAQGTFDNNTGGNNGISLNCYVGYELNWQGGHLKCTTDGGTTSANITLDSALQFSDNVIVCSTADDLAAKYAAAKSLTPGGNSLSATNRATLVIMPGTYSLSSTLNIDTEYVDILGLGSIKLDRGCVTAVKITGGEIRFLADDIKVKGIELTGNYLFTIGSSTTGYQLPSQIFEDCISLYTSGSTPFGPVYASGTFINCIGGNNAFAGANSGTANGTFVNCVGGNYSFGGGGVGGMSSGTFVNCIGGNQSFGGYGTASGSFINCTAGNGGFGGAGLASGYFDSCSAGWGSFGGFWGTSIGTASGTFISCIAGDQGYSFGGGLGCTASGTFIDCRCTGTTGGSFGGAAGTASGKFLKCILSTGTFPTPTGSGKIRLCIDGNYDVINADAP